MAGVKKCGKCGNTKPLSEFYRVMSEGVRKPHTYCKSCKKSASAAYEKSETRREYLRDYYQIKKARKARASLGTKRESA